jgi:hypothetical protein
MQAKRAADNLTAQINRLTERALTAEQRNRDDAATIQSLKEQAAANE